MTYQETVRLLYIEDDPIAARLLQKRLESLNFDIDVARDGDTGLKKYISDSYDVVIVDQQLPVYQGTEVIRMLKHADGKTPIVMLTGTGDEALAVEAFRVGAVDYIIKDYERGYLELLPTVITQAIEHQRLIDAKQEAERLLWHSNVELQARNTELDAYSYTVAHDLKTPLQAIIGYTYILNEMAGSRGDEEAHTYLNEILRASNKMRSMIDNLLLLARLRDATEVIEATPMKKVVEAAVLRFDDQTKARGIDLEIEDNLPSAMGYGPWIEEVFANLFNNAVKYIGRDNTAPRIHIRGYQRDGLVFYEIEDNGPGIAPKNQPQLFEMFSRFHQREASGSGIGLSIVQRIIKKLNGEVGVRSTPGAGSTFWFCLPAVPD